MCGIAGVWQTDGAPVDPHLLSRMCDRLAHRGPDGDEGVMFDTRTQARPVFLRQARCANATTHCDLGLGHRRLAIIDLRTGDQPMSSADGSLWLVFNGEIYNYRELRDELRARGRQFRTQSDTEVILHAYAEFGTACPSRLNGIF